MIRGDGATAAALRELVETEGGDLAGREGFQLVPASACGPQPSIVVDTDGSAIEEVIAAVHGGHAAATASIELLAGDAAIWGVLAADGRVGVSAALLPGLPLVALLTDLATLAAPVTVELDGDDPALLAAEAVGVARLLGRELRVDQVQVDAPAVAAPYVAIVGERFPWITAGSGPLAAGERRARVRIGHDHVHLEGTVGAPARVAAALFHDVLVLAREDDRPWRAHRRRGAAT